MDNRIAIVFFGMLRCFEHTEPFFKRHFEELKNYQIDYFFYGYPNAKGIEYCKNKLQDIFNPQDFKIIEWNDDVKNAIIKECEGILDLSLKQVGSTQPIACLSQHRCRYHANELRKNWAIKNNIKHDVVLLARIDSFPFRDLTMEDVDNCKKEQNGIFIPEDWDFKCVHDVAVSDTFAMGCEQAMNIFAESYKHFPNLVRKEGYHFHPETLLGAHVLKSGLKRFSCKRHIAFEYPFSKDDIFELWKENWKKEEVERVLNISLEEVNHDHRKNM